MAEAKDEAGGTVWRYELGVVVVHGMGRQRKGETLKQFVDGLIRWFDTVVLSTGSQFGTSVAKVETGHEIMLGLWKEGQQEHEVPERQQKWLVSEAWWAETFDAPSYPELLRWALQILPVTLSDQVQKLSYYCTARLGKAWLHALIATGLILAASALLPLVGVLLLFILATGWIPKLSKAAHKLQALLAEVVGDSLAFVGSAHDRAEIVAPVVERIRGALKHCQRVCVIAHSQGAAVVHHALAQIPLTMSRNSSLITYGSGLEKLVRMELRDRRSGGRPGIGPLLSLIPPLLLLALAIHATIALGSRVLVLLLGVAVVTALLFQTLRPYILGLAGARRKWEALWRGVIAVTWISMGIQLPAWLDLRIGWPVVAFAVVLIGMLTRVAWTDYEMTQDNLKNTWYRELTKRADARPLAPPFQVKDGLGRVYRELPQAWNVHLTWRWTDLYSSHDPVPAGSLFLVDDLDAASFRRYQRDIRTTSLLVHNRGSILGDHTAYWDNRDQFVTKVIERLLVASDFFPDIDPDGHKKPPLKADYQAVREVGHLADERRPRRVTALRVARLSTLLGGMVAGLTAFKSTPEAVSTALQPWILRLSEAASERAVFGPWLGGWTALWNALPALCFTAVVVALCFSLWFVVVSGLWRLWDDHAIWQCLKGRSTSVWWHSAAFAAVSMATLSGLIVFVWLLRTSGN